MRATEVRALLRRGLEAFRQGDHDTAFEQFTRVSQVRGDRWQGFYWRGMVYLERRQFDKAIVDFDRAIRLKSNLDRARRHRRTAEILHAAIEDFLTVPRDQPAQDYKLFRLKMRDATLPARILDDLDEQLDATPRDPHLLRRRAVGRINQGNFAGGIEDLNAALEVDPKSPEAWLARGVAHLNREDYEAATNDLQQALALEQPKPSPAVLIHLANVAQRTGQLDLSIERLDQAHALHGPNAAACTLRGVIDRQQGRVREASRQLAQAIGLDPETVEAYFQQDYVEELLGLDTLGHRETLRDAPLSVTRAESEDFLDGLPDRREISLGSFMMVRNAVVRVCRRYGRVGPRGIFQKDLPSDPPFDFWIEESQYNEFERRQRIEVEPTAFTAGLVEDLATMLVRWPGWGVVVSNLERGRIVIESDRVRIFGPILEGAHDLESLIRSARQALTNLDAHNESKRLDTP